jgi:hypothetical protein
MTKIAGSGSISQRHGSAEPDSPQNVMDPQHWLKQNFVPTLAFLMLKETLLLRKVSTHFLFLTFWAFVFHLTLDPDPKQEPDPKSAKCIN